MKHLNKSVLGLGLAGLILRIIFSVQIYSGDVNNHMSWGKDLLISGGSGIYEREFFKRNNYGTMTPTYPPVALVMFGVSEAFYQGFYNISWSLNNNVPVFPSKLIYFVEDQDTRPAFFKIWAILADIGIAFLIYRMTKSKLAMSLVLFNPAFFYNSAYWGQTEAISTFFVLLAVYWATKIKNLFAVIASLVLALLTKQSAIIFLPLVLLWTARKYEFRKLTNAVTLGIVIFWIAFLPFYKSGNLLLYPFEIYLNKIQTGSGSDLVVDHAFNFWALLGFENNKLSDKTIAWAGLSFFQIGLALFGVHYLVLIAKMKDEKELIFAMGLAAAFAFMYLTRMHERYLEPSLPFLLIASYKNKKLLGGFVFLSIFSFLNLYHNWWTPGSETLKNFLLDFKNIQFLITVFAVGIYAFLVRYLQIGTAEKN